MPGAGRVAINRNHPRGSWPPFTPDRLMRTQQHSVLPRFPHLRRTLALAACTVAVLLSTPIARESAVSGPQGQYPYTVNSAGKRTAFAPAPSDPSWSLLAASRAPSSQQLHVVAFMVEFNGGEPDTNPATTGTGLFGIWQDGAGTPEDIEEIRRYDSDTVYRYDDLAHDRQYFQQQFRYAETYFQRVSRGRFDLAADIFPRTPGAAYSVDKQMSYYSPGGKYAKETWDEYYIRLSRLLMEFVADAIRAADEQGGTNGPFSVVASIDADGVPRDSAGVPIGFMVIHAGASYLTDGGTGGAFNANSPSDMIDAFISADFMRYYRDDVDFDTVGSDIGVLVTSGAGDLLLDELMMLPETSNQDGLNWGIHGVLVNQIARQIGLPDLYSTSGGLSGIGAFCILDFAGYSAAQGFIPPYPSAWVRAVMGWDEPRVVTPAQAASYRLKAVGTAGSTEADTTMLLVPLNDHEYFLIENRQRNPEGRSGVFDYDTTEDNEVYIAPFPYNTTIEKNVVDSTGPDSANTIQDVYHYDIGLPASGVLIWHVDEDVLRERLESNLVNADSLYRGISLVEADGINDLGILFQDALSQAAFDWGGAEDVFPHRRLGDEDHTVDSLGPYTRPSTRSNDGGQSNLTMHIVGDSDNSRYEKYAVRDYFVRNFTDTVFTITVDWDYLAAGWPRRIAPDSIHEPLVVDLVPSLPGLEVVVLDRSGRMTVLPTLIDSLPSVNRQSTLVPVVDLRGDAVADSSGTPLYDTAFYAAQVTDPVAMPTAIGTEVYIPTSSGDVQIATGIDGAGVVQWEALSLPGTPSTHVCGYAQDHWAVGMQDGRVAMYEGRTSLGTVALDDSAAVDWVAALPGMASSVVVVQHSGLVSICTEGMGSAQDTFRVSGLPPYKLVTGDLDANDSGTAEVVVADSRQGLWVLDNELSLAPGWVSEPNDWASAYAYNEEEDFEDRTLLPRNPSCPSLADINGDGCLDILVGGTNGIYALNYKGVLVKGWPYYLDNRYWLQRGSVTATPVAVSDGDDAPLVLFSSPTGDNPTFGVERVIDVDASGTKVYFEVDGVLDSIWDLEASLVDSLLRYGDSLIYPYLLPGGYVDAVTPEAERPLREIARLANVGREPIYDWPLTVGATVGTSPLVCDLDSNDATDLIAVSARGFVYRWELDPSLLSVQPGQWSMAGYAPSRPFAYLGPPPSGTGGTDTIGFYSFPNPAVDIDEVVFRYAFTGRAKDVRIDVYTYTGHHVYSWKEPAGAARVNYPDWNEHAMSLRRLGPAVYRCRLGATIDGREYSRFWKLAVVK